MFTQSLIAFVALASYMASPVLAVPGAAWIRRQEDAQTALTLDPAAISVGIQQDGQGDNPDPAQVRSATSVNNFINHCLISLDQGVPLTDGKQIATGSCSQTPMGRIISLDQAPRSKFVFPKNGDESLVENQAFTVQMKILNLVTGNFVNAQSNYYSAPQQVNDQGIVIGHSHVTIQLLPDLKTTEPLDPTKFAFFKGFNDAAQNDVLSAAVTGGLPAGAYRMCSINTAANHQIALVSNAQHGSIDDCSYFTVKPAGQGNNNTNNNNNSASSSASNTNTASATASVSESSASVSATATDSASVSNSAELSTATDASSTDAATATESSSAAPEQSSDGASQEQPSATSSESSQAPEPTAGDNNGNNNNNGDNNGNNNGNQGNNDQNNGNNGDNNNNQGNNDQNNNGNNGDGQSSSEAPAPTDQNNGNNGNNGNEAPTDNSSAAPAPTDNATSQEAAPAPTDNATSQEAAPAPTDNATSQEAAPSPSPDASSEAPAPEASPSQGNDNAGTNGNDNTQGADQGNNGQNPIA